MKVLITGGKGQLGSELKTMAADYPAYSFFFTDRDTLDITHKKAVSTFVDTNKIEIIINCAAYTAVDRAEEEKELADQVNCSAVKILAQLAKERNLKLIHISTDYVFDGKSYVPYTAEHKANPINHYGRSKWKGERAILAFHLPNALVIRTSWLFSAYGNNFVKTMMRLGAERKELNVIDDQVGTPTCAKDLAEFLLKHALSYTSNKTSIYHFTNEGVCSWYDFAKEIMQMTGLKCQINPIPTTSYPTLAARPQYSLLDKSALKKDFGISIPYWKDSLYQCIATLKNNT